MEGQELYHEPELSIGMLAARAGMPEYVLRRLINDRLGYRNFAAFLGERRVAAAKTALADPENARRPVSSIAFDVGFNSLASFNRVFRELAGVTPTGFRQQALGGAIPENPPQN